MIIIVFLAKRNMIIIVFFGEVMLICNMYLVSTNESKLTYLM